MPSVYVHTTVVVVVIGKVVVVVPVTVPVQLSVAVGAVRLGTLHWFVMVGKFAVSATGAVVSVIFTCWFCVLVFVPSVYVHMTVVVVVIGKVVVVVPVTLPVQLSVAVGAVKLATLHWSVTVAKVVVFATGAVVSLITIF